MGQWTRTPQFLPLTTPESMDDFEKLDWIIDNYSQACLEHDDLRVQGWASKPPSKVRIARLAKDRYNWDLRKILDLMKSGAYEEI